MTLKEISVLSENNFTDMLIVGKGLIYNIPITFYLKKLSDGYYESIIYESLDYSLSESLEETLIKNFIQNYKENPLNFINNIKDNLKSDWNLLWFKRMHELFVLFHINNKPFNYYNSLKNNILKKFPEITSLELYNVDGIE